MFLSLTLFMKTPPDVLEKIQKTLDEVNEIDACWKLLKGLDKTQQLYFVPKDRSHLKEVKKSLDFIFESRHYELQGSWLSESMGRITYNFVKESEMAAILEQHPVVGRQTIVPHCPHFIPITFGLEVAVTSVGKIPGTRKTIDTYLQAKYGAMSL